MSRRAFQTVVGRKLNASLNGLSQSVGVHLGLEPDHGYLQVDTLWEIIPGLSKYSLAPETNVTEEGRPNNMRVPMPQTLRIWCVLVSSTSIRYSMRSLIVYTVS
jgi:hypothetical protein